MKLLSPKFHGYIDYVTSAVFALAPALFMIEGVPAAVMGCYVIAGGLLLVPLVPFTVHGALELLGAPVIVAYPWIAGFERIGPARNFYIVAGVAVFLLWLITDYRAADRPETVA